MSGMPCNVKISRRASNRLHMVKGPYSSIAQRFLETKKPHRSVDSRDSHKYTDCHANYCLKEGPTYQARLIFGHILEYANDRQVTLSPCRMCASKSERLQFLQQIVSRCMMSHLQRRLQDANGPRNLILTSC